jgi:hypothetical protein
VLLHSSRQPGVQLLPHDDRNHIVGHLGQHRMHNPICQAAVPGVLHHQIGSAQLGDSFDEVVGHVIHEHVLCRSAAHGKHIQHPPRAWRERLDLVAQQGAHQCW